MEPIFMNRTAKLFAGAAIGLSVLGGAAAGYAVASKRLRSAYEQAMSDELQEIREFYSQARVVQEDKPDPGDLVSRMIANGEAEVASQLKAYSGEVEVGTPEDVDESAGVVEDSERHNIFDEREDSDDPNWNIEEEQTKRDAAPNDPYVISKDEFNANETEFDQEEMTFYEGDNVLADQNQQPVHDTDAVVGPEALTRFGHGSGDENHVFVRNDNHEAEYFITRSNDSYAHAVLGWTDEDESSLKHSGHPKFRLHGD